MSSNQYRTPLSVLSEHLKVDQRGILPPKVMVLAPSVQALWGLRREVAIKGETALVNVEFGTLPTFVNELVKANDPSFWRLRVQDRELYSLIRVALKEIALEFTKWSDIDQSEELTSRLAISIADRAWAPPSRIESIISRKTSDLVEVAYAKVFERLGDRWYFDGQLFKRANELLEDEAFCQYLSTNFPTIILYLPHGLVLPSVEFAAKLLSKVDGCLIYGSSGSSEIDAEFEELIPREFFLERDVAVIDCFSLPRQLQRVDLPDPRSEVTYVVQRIVAALDAGVDLAEISVTFSDRVRYLDILRSAFDEVGVTTSLTDDRRSVVAVFASLVSRLTQLDSNSNFYDLLVLLADLKAAKVRHGEILSYASSPFLIGSPKIFAASYDKVPSQLRYLAIAMSKLFSFADSFRAIISNPNVAEGQWSAAGKRLHFLIKEFVTSNLDDFSMLGEVSEGVDEFGELLLRLNEVDNYVSKEVLSAPALWSIINSMVEEVEATIVGESQLLRVQSVSSAPCISNRIGFFLGLTDDVFPPRPPRSLLDGNLRERLGLLSDRKSEALANRSLAMSISMCHEVIVTVPRVDTVEEKTLHPAEVLSTVEALFLSSEAVERLRFDSTLAMIEGDRLPPMEELMVKFATTVGPIGTPSKAPKPIFSLPKGLNSSNTETPLSSNSEDGQSIALSETRAIFLSPTSVEEWIKCPYEYFVRRILKVDQFRNFDEIGFSDPLARGSYSHKVIELLLSKAISPSDDMEVAFAVEDEGYVELPWHTPRLKLLRKIEAQRVMREAKWAKEFFRRFCDDLDLLIPANSVEFEAELPSIEIEVDGGTIVGLRGRADMVVRHNQDANRVVAIVDFKSGSSSYFGGGGSGSISSVQLVLYDEMLSSDGHGARLEYWFFNERRNIERKVVDPTWRSIAKVSSRSALGAIANNSYSRYHHLKDDGSPCSFCYPFGRRDNIAGVEVSEIEALSSAYEAGLLRQDG
ncbi:MAG: PD-(D/E)XK nuclease family protein [Actinomycetota bacterium]|nr:PD-(D/E)XK nuclease family protein [Actinomycetota bacterium]